VRFTGYLPFAPSVSTRMGAVGALILFLSGCTAVWGSGSATPGSNPQQGVVYQGFLILDGGEGSAALEIAREGRRDVRAALQAASGLMADGRGRVRGERLSIELEYGGPCPGTMKLDGEWDQDSGTYEGDLSAQDCTGKAEGTFYFSRD
jgi:hypothetical protein